MGWANWSKVVMKYLHLLQVHKIKTNNINA